MGIYDGKICPVCHKSFHPGDDIVVCPECGTPHHRACFEQIGVCANQDRHGTGWTADEPPAQEQIDPDANPTDPAAAPVQEHPDGIVCSQCGMVNPSDGLFCCVCGNDLRAQAEQDTANQPYQAARQSAVASMLGGMHPDDQLDGVEVRDLMTVVGANTAYYLPRFKAFSERRPVAVNFTAFFFPGLYYLYRKMLAEGVFFLVLQLTLAISTLVLYFHAQTPVDNAALITTMTYVSNICQYLSFALCLLSGLFANRLYYAHVRRVIQKTKQQFVGAAQEYTSELVRRGSVSPLATGIGFLASSFLSVMAMYMVIYLMY